MINDGRPSDDDDEDNSGSNQVGNGIHGPGGVIVAGTGNLTGGGNSSDDDGGVMLWREVVDTHNQNQKKVQNQS